MKRLLIAIVGSLALLVGVAGATTEANEFSLTVVSQTNTTITFSYPQQPGYGYLYSANGVVVSRTNDPTKTTIKFTKANSYEVAAIVKGTTGTYPTTPPPPPPAAQCSDGVNNDPAEDTLIDYPADPGCTSATDNTELGNPPPPPTATFTQSIQAGATLSGKVDWHAVYDANNDGVEDDPGSVRFILDGTLIRTELDAPFGSEPNNPSVTFWDSTTVANGSHTFKVEAVDANNVVVATSGPVTATVDNTVAPPPPPPSGTPLFDGRATQMNTLTGSTIKVGDSGWAGSSNSYQDPIMWGDPPFTSRNNGIYCMTDSCTLITDPTYNKVYRFNIGPGDTNPYFDQPTKPNGELSVARPAVMGQTDWYSDAFKIVGPYTLGSFNVIAQYCYPSQASPPLSISFDSTGVGIDRHVGVLKAQGDLTGPDTIITKPRFWPVSTVLDKWVEMVIGVTWHVPDNGEIWVYARVKALGETNFTLVYHDTTRPTWQVIQGQSLHSSCTDKMGLYFGTFTSPPTNTVLHRGFQRWNNQADAIASMG